MCSRYRMLNLFEVVRQWNDMKTISIFLDWVNAFIFHSWTIFFLLLCLVPFLMYKPGGLYHFCTPSLTFMKPCGRIPPITPPTLCTPQLLIQFPQNVRSHLVAGMVTFYPDSKHRTSVNPGAAPRLRHEREDGKQGARHRAGAGACEGSFPWINSDLFCDLLAVRAN